MLGNHLVLLILFLGDLILLIAIIDDIAYCKAYNII